MRKKMFFPLFAMLLSCLFVVYNFDDALAEPSAKDAAMLADYVGWWSAEKDATTPFVFLEIRAADAILGYDKFGKLVDKGFVVFGAQSAKNKAHSMELIMNKTGQFTVKTRSMAQDKRQIDIAYVKLTGSFVHQKTPPTFSKPSATPMNDADLEQLLIEALGDKINGKTIMDAGSEKIHGHRCNIIKYGTMTTERFQTEKHFAVCVTGDVYVLNILDGEWAKYN